MSGVVVLLWLCLLCVLATPFGFTFGSVAIECPVLLIVEEVSPANFLGVWTSCSL